MFLDESKDVSSDISRFRDSSRHFYDLRQITRVWLYTVKLPVYQVYNLIIKFFQPGVNVMYCMKYVFGNLIYCAMALNMQYRWQGYTTVKPP